MRPSEKVPSPLPRSTRRRVVALVGGDDVDLAIAVEVAHRDRARCCPVGKTSCGSKVPSPLPSSTLTVLSPRLDVTMSGMPSPLKSAVTSVNGFEPDREDLLGLKRAVAVAQEHAHGVVDRVGDDEVGLAVAVDVHRIDRVGPDSGGKTLCGPNVPSPWPSRTATLAPT